MAAAKTVPQLAQSHNSLTPHYGVLTLVGYGIQVRVDRGHLLVEDGIGAERHQARLPRVRHGLKRLVVIGSEGMVSLAALRWLANQDASLVMLERDGKTLCVTGPVGSSDAKLRRAQALAIGNGLGLEICRRLIDAKLQGQEQVLRERLNCQPTADVIARVRNNIGSAESFDAIRNLEANAASSYFGEWRDLPVTWPKADLQKIPEHWKFVGSRKSPLSGGPRLAVTPAHAILNYCFALLEAETRLALSISGLDPGLGVGLHTDTANRDSLAFDVLEPVRPQIEMWLLDWVAREPLRRADFFETTTGNCRLMSQMCTKLSETASIWGKLVAPWAEYVARTLWVSCSTTKASEVMPTRITQQHRRVAKGRPPLAAVGYPKVDRICRYCGRQIQRAKKYCSQCAATATLENFDAGRNAAQGQDSLEKRSVTQRQHKQAIKRWNPSDLPARLTRDLYITQIQPALINVVKTRIRLALGVSEPYSSNIQAGKRIPHPRHWLALAELAGLTGLADK
jgi:CRISPR-associated endonuclease Cas1